MQNLKEDEATMELRKNLVRLWTDFCCDRDGIPDIFAFERSCSELKHIIHPIIKKNLEDLPIDKIEIENEYMQARVENIVFQGLDLLPEDIEIDFRSKFRAKLAMVTETSLGFTVKLGV